MSTYTRIQLRRDTSTNWTSADPVLAEGEIGLELDTDQFKVGDGTAAWSALAYGGIQGPQGEQGPQGIQGEPGEDGAKWHDGTGAPDSALGTDGDYYLDASNGDVYAKASGTWSVAGNLTGPQGEQGPQGETGPQGEQGPKGDPGDDGNTWHSGEGSPSDTIGVNGDFYLDTLNRAYWGPKDAGTWTGTGPEYLDAAPVQSVHGRTGTVTAQTGDYTAEQVGADPEGSADAAETAAKSYTDDHATETGGIHGAPAFARLVHSSSLIREAVEAQRMGLTRQRLIRKDGAGTLAIDRKITGASGDAAGWNPETEDDGTVGTLALGDDIYIYWADGQLVASRNDDGPDGTTEWLMLGGFHYGRIRPFSEAYNHAFTCPIEIVPNAVWDQVVRPTCDPTGMVEIIPGSAWWGIYLATEGPGAWPETTARSEYNAVPVTGSDGYSRLDFIRLASNAGGRIIRGYEEFRAGAYGVPQGATGLDGRTNTGQHGHYGFDCVSCKNVDQPSGNIWQIAGDAYDRSTSNSWNDTLNAGKDSAADVGQWYGGEFRMSLVGGHWGNGAQAGAGCVVLGSAPWDVSSATGVRVACDSL